MNSNLNATAAVIYLKNGKRKYGILMDEQYSTHDYQFISNDNILNFNNTMSKEYVEIVPTVLIESIDVDLK